jgi:YHS domain-containing protein
MVKDPVCGVTVDEKTAKFKSLYELNVYYFDSEKCKAEFDENPQKYVDKMKMQHHASHYGGYCPTPGCGKPQKGSAWYFYIGLLILLITALILYSFSRLLV